METCDETCWREQLCTVSNLVMEELATCLNSSLKEGFYEKAKHTTPAPVLVITTMPQRKGFGHDHEDHADHFPAVPEEKEDVSKEKLEVINPQ